MIAGTVLRLGTRASRLARWQTNRIMFELRQAHAGLDCVAVQVATAGDRDRQTPLPEIGGKGVFTEALERSLLTGDIDVAVHSLKDLPIEDRPELTLGAVCLRADARDVLVARDGWTLDTLPAGARVGTSSTRRAAQLLAARPDLNLIPVRGNVDTRVRKAKEGACDATILAAAGVERLDLTEAVSEYLSFEQMLPAPGQGALAVQCRVDDSATLALLQSLDDAAVRAAVGAERAFLAGLGGGCAAPVAAYARRAGDERSLHMRGLVGAPDGTRIIRVEGTAPEADWLALGGRLAEEALAAGAQEFLS